ncbi:chorismate synthase [Candidatus Aquiluna sp. UB-MaderosW2red]|jgi:chorismate synthase|uniref:chorismate synthase n=1 Tax=Candidatus Aquiluna sp. UB-MaderosW2red TaxID=1855377 RepID=UPI000875B933|nr:chorismate synthase [Candidatus Aquiluna sp. UB-MaderosW2red]SCX11583.1 chorismate synthase [Candidatus Aquiluna sp. UB-MaderosW2red]
MLRFITAGESHGPELIGVLEGLPAGVAVLAEDIQAALARRRLGYGRGARMKFELDEVTISSGVRFGLSQGGPIAIRIANTEWPKWEKVMSAAPVDQSELSGARGAPLTRPRPGHADFTGMQKYNFEEARPVLERASARETATRVALGAIAQSFLKSLGIELVTHTVAIGPVQNHELALPRPSDRAVLDEDPMRCFDKPASEKMVAEIDDCHSSGDTVGGVVETLVYGCPPGLGSYVHHDRKLDGQLAQAVMGIQAIKSVEIGDGLETTRRRGSVAHDEIIRENDLAQRVTDRAGGIEGGMSNGEIIRVRAGMKPISTVPKALRTLDTSTGEAATAHHQRSDVCAVPAAGIVLESMVALVIANSVMEKFGGDSISETKRNLDSYLENIPAVLRSRIVKP